MSNTAPHKVWMLTAQLEGQHHVTDQEPDESKRHIYIEYIRADLAADREREMRGVLQELTEAADNAIRAETTGDEQVMLMYLGPVVGKAQRTLAALATHEHNESNNARFAGQED